MKGGSMSNRMKLIVDSGFDFRRDIVSPNLVNNFKEVTDIYDVNSVQNSIYLRNAILTLRKALELILQALEALKDDRIIESDNCVMLFGGLLPELFCCRSIGDGYCSIVNAIIIAMENKKGDFLGFDQLQELKKVTTRILNEPFMKFEESINLIDELEEVGFKTSLESLSFVTDIS